jgi:hypothetical protein
MDIYNLILEITNLPNTETICIVLFISFRTLIYCDECHDFLDSRSKISKSNKSIFSDSRRKQLYNDVLEFIKNKKWENKVTNLIYSQDNDYYNNFIRLFFRESGDKFIPNLRATILNKYKLETIDNIAIKFKVDMYKSLQTTFIVSDGIAKQISEWILDNIFKIKSMPISSILSCAYEFDIYKSIKFITMGILKKNASDNTELKINIDATQSEKALIPFYNSLFDLYLKNKNCDNLSKNFVTDIKQNTNISYFTNLANIYDPSLGDSLLKTLKSLFPQNIIETIPEPNKENILYFSGIEIIKYTFNDTFSSESNISLSLTKYFSNELGGNAIESSQSSVSKISQIIEDTQKYEICAYKTMGDFLQIISFIQTQKKYPNFMYCFVTADILCSKIASILTPYVIGELNVKDNFAGISMFFSNDQINLIDSIPESQKLLQNRIINYTEGTKLDDFLNDLLNDNYNVSFGNNSNLNNNLISTAKEFGICYKNKSREKLKNHIDKIILLAKKYRIKLNKITVKNIKKAIKIHNIAKKYTIKLTKMNKNNRRVYKTIKELLIEINKNEQNEQNEQK